MLAERVHAQAPTHGHALACFQRAQKGRQNGLNKDALLERARECVEDIYRNAPARSAPPARLTLGGEETAGEVASTFPFTLMCDATFESTPTNERIKTKVTGIVGAVGGVCFFAQHVLSIQNQANTGTQSGMPHIQQDEVHKSQAGGAGFS